MTKLGEAHASTKLLILFLEFRHSSLEVCEVGLSPITRILGSDTISVCTSLFTFFWGNL